MTRRYAQIIIALGLSLFASLSWAVNVASGGASTSLGEAATSVTTLLSHAHGIIEIVFFLCGAAMGTSAVLKYRLHRRNPQQVPLITPLLEGTIAIVLLIIPFAIEFSSSSEVIEEAKPVPTPSGEYYRLPPGTGNPQAPSTPPPGSPYPY